MRPAHRRSQKSRLDVKAGNYRGLCRRTEPQDPDKHMQAFLDHGTVPRFCFKTSREKVQASLSNPLQVVRTEHMCIATSILDRVVEEWGCVEDLIQTTRGKQIDRPPEEVIDEYLKYHGVPGKIQIRWVQQMNCGGRFQEIGRRDNPTGRRLRLWISRGFTGATFSSSLTAFANHEIGTHAVRAINDHVQVWTNERGRYGLKSCARERLSTEEGLASLNGVICYPSRMRYLWSAALMYYCAVKGQDLGFGELHKHLIKYVRSPAKRYWYCVRTKGKLDEPDKPGASGKGQVYLEGAVEILRSVDTIDFHLLYSGRVPLSKLARVKNIARPSLVTLPRFLRDQAKYKNTLKQIGRLNGIISETPSRLLINQRTAARRTHPFRGLHAAASETEPSSGPAENCSSDWRTRGADELSSYPAECKSHPTVMKGPDTTPHDSSVDTEGESPINQRLGNLDS